MGGYRKKSKEKVKNGDYTEVNKSALLSSGQLSLLAVE